MNPFKNKKKFKSDEDGVALVEFAIFLPLFVLAFFVVVEFSRVFFSYQGAIVGVRDSARYLARVSDGQICEDAGNTGGFVQVVATSGDQTGGLINAKSVVKEIIVRNMDNEVEGILPEKVSLIDDTISATYVCVEANAGDYRQARVPIVQVSATFRIILPLAGILELNGQPLIPEITHQVTDQSRIFGL